MSLRYLPTQTIAGFYGISGLPGRLSKRQGGLVKVSLKYGEVEAPSFSFFSANGFGEWV